MKSIERFVNFSDAVIAIAVTLLVLPLTEHAAGKSFDSYDAFMHEFGSLLLVFILSFVVICRYWEVHHGLLSSLKAFDIPLFWLNALWLLSIVLMPFTSEIIANAPNSDTFTTIVYIGNLMVTSYVGLAMGWYVAHKPELRKADVAEDNHFQRGFTTAIGMTLALGVNLLVPVGPIALLLLIPAGFADRFFVPKVRSSKKKA